MLALVDEINHALQISRRLLELCEHVEAMWQAGIDVEGYRNTAVCR